MINIINLCASYGKHTILNNLNLEFEEGKIHGIAGLNGSGKTTLFNCMFGIKEYTGKISLIKKDISYVETDSFFYSKITGKEYLSLFKDKNDEADKLKTMFNLPLDKYVEDYSAGMKKKLALIAGLTFNRPVLIADEPFNGMDLEGNQSFKYILKIAAEKGKTVLISSHIIETLEDLCDKIHYLANGSIQKSYNKNDFKLFKSDIISDFETKINLND